MTGDGDDDSGGASDGDSDGFDVLPTPVDNQQILATFARYAVALDAGDAAAWVACFTPDVDYAVVMRGIEEPLHHAVGREALWAYRTSHPVVGVGVAWQHVVSNIQVAVDATGRRARASSYWTSIAADPQPTILAFGVYRDELRRQDDGSWLFSRRITETHARQTPSA